MKIEKLNEKISTKNHTEENLYDQLYADEKLQTDGMASEQQNNQNK